MQKTLPYQPMAQVDVTSPGSIATDSPVYPRASLWRMRTRVDIHVSMLTINNPNMIQKVKLYVNSEVRYKMIELKEPQMNFAF